MQVIETLKAVWTAHVTLLIGSAALLAFAWPESKAREQAAMAELKALSEPLINERAFKSLIDTYAGSYHYSKYSAVEKVFVIPKDQSVEEQSRDGIGPEDLMDEVAVYFPFDPFRARELFRPLRYGAYIPNQNAAVKDWVRWLLWETKCQTIDIDYLELARALLNLVDHYHNVDPQHDHEIVAHLVRIENLNATMPGLPQNAEVGVKYEMRPVFTKTTIDGITVYRIEQDKIKPGTLHSYRTTFTVEGYEGHYEVETNDPLATVHMHIPDPESETESNEVAMSNRSWVDTFSSLDDLREDGRYLANVDTLIHVIGEDTLDAAIAKLHNRIHSPDERFEVFDFSIGKRSILVLAPMAILTLFAVFDCHLHRLVFLDMHCAEEAEGFPWIGLYSALPARILFAVSMLVPFTALVLLGVKAESGQGSSGAAFGIYLLLGVLNVTCTLSALRSWARIHGRSGIRLGTTGKHEQDSRHEQRSDGIGPSSTDIDAADSGR